MFERCDADTVAVLEAARDQARRLGHDWVGTEHVLLALARHRDTLPGPVAELLPGADGLRTALIAHFGERSTLPRAELLASLGIDLDGVRAAVLETFGEEALDRLRQPVHQPWQPWRRPNRSCMSLLAGSMAVMPRVKQSLEIAWRDAVERQQTAIAPAGLLLGMVEVEGFSNRLLRDAGVSPDDLRVALRAVS